jgi:hypothetical protein
VYRVHHIATGLFPAAYFSPASGLPKMFVLTENREALLSQRMKLVFDDDLAHQNSGTMHKTQVPVPQFSRRNLRVQT